MEGGIIVEGGGEFLSTVCTCRTEEVYLHRGGGLGGVVFTGEVFTREVFTVRSDVGHLSAVAISADGVPGH